MKDNYVILNEEYSPEGIYHIEINTHLGVFDGLTVPDEIDSKYLSSYHASEIALAKALRKFAKAAVSQTKREITMLEGMIKQACDFAEEPADIDNNAFRILNGTLKQKKIELNKWNNRIKNLTTNIKNRIAARDRLVASYNEIVASYNEKDKIE